MKKSVGVILLIAVSFSFVGEDETIAWNDVYHLTWSDFRGKPNYDTDAAAVTASGISYTLAATLINKKAKVDCKVNAFFYPERSWYKKELSDSVILSHERLHFDITELYARKMRSIINSKEFDHHVKSSIRKIYREINTELDSMQQAYDAATDYSRNLEQQIQWEQYISSLLIQ